MRSPDYLPNNMRSPYYLPNYMTFFSVVRPKKLKGPAETQGKRARFKENSDQQSSDPRVGKGVKPLVGSDHTRVASAQGLSNDLMNE